VKKAEWNMVRDRFVELGGLAFHYRDWGGRGRPMILLHGLASQSHIYDLMAPLLAQHFCITALDQRGHGESAKPNWGYDFGSVCADLAKFLDEMHLERVILVGHSWGGNVVLQYAALHPEQVLALVLVDGGFLDIQANPEMTWERTQELLAPPRLSGISLGQFKRMLKKHLGNLYKPAIEDVILRNFEILPNQTIRPYLSFEHHMMILRAMWEQRPSTFYSQLKCPVLMAPAISDDRDARSREMASMKRSEIALAKSVIAQCETRWFKHTVHDIPLQRPRKLASAISRFCSNNL
jgi:pimeloyl-ACP methyl ester carboxylesterase